MSYQNDVISLPLSTSVLGKLLRVGITTTDCLTGADVSILSKSAGVTKNEAEEVLKTAADASNGRNDFKAKSAFEIFQEEQNQVPIVTFSEKLDLLLDGGFALGQLTEICGPPGSGKTQLCLQLAVDVHIPESLGGVEGEAVYIDSEGGMVVERLEEIATAAVGHCQQICASSDSMLKGEAEKDSITVKDILAGIHCFNCSDYYEIMAAVSFLPEFLTANKKIKLIIIDSLARPFRCNMEDMSLRRRLLTTLTQKMHQIASVFKVAVVVTNQMTTKILPREGDSHLIPALGDNWAHSANTRVILSSSILQGRRTAMLCKSSHREGEQCTFHITNDGIRDVD